MEDGMDERSPHPAFSYGELYHVYCQFVESSNRLLLAEGFTRSFQVTKLHAKPFAEFKDDFRGYTTEGICNELEDWEKVILRTRGITKDDCRRQR